jgi:hypothetical protein
VPEHQKLKINLSLLEIYLLLQKRKSLIHNILIQFDRHKTLFSSAKLDVFFYTLYYVSFSSVLSFSLMHLLKNYMSCLNAYRNFLPRYSSTHKMMEG